MKRQRVNKSWIVASLAMIPLGLPVLAATVQKAHQFTGGTTISSSQVNANFDQMVTELNAKEARITAAEALISTLQSSLAGMAASSSSTQSSTLGGRLVRDAQGSVLGTLIGHSGTSIQLISPAGYVYSLKIDGGLVANVSYLFGTDATCATSSYAGFYFEGTANRDSRFLVVNNIGSLYKFSSSMTDGTATRSSDTSISTTGGYYQRDPSGGCYGPQNGPSLNTYGLYPITAITRTTAGLPVTIIPPLSY